MDKNSLLYWYPNIKDLDIPQPRTEVVMFTEEEFETSFEGCPKSWVAMPTKFKFNKKTLTAKVQDCIDNHFSLPVFIRSDLSSAKHRWDKACFYDGSRDLWKHLFAIIIFNHCADFMGLCFTSMAVREFIPMATGFTAFYGDMPVNPERRYFIKDGEVICHHAYWIKEAIAASKPPSIENWEEVADQLNTETDEEIKLLSGYALKVAKVLDGFWSVDFCKALDGRWILIDLALGEQSWHPEECEESQHPAVDIFETTINSPCSGMDDIEIVPPRGAEDGENPEI